MILRRWSLHVNDFAVQASEYNAPKASAVISAHNAGTTLSLSLNYEWRRLISALLTPLLLREYWDGTESEVDDAIQKAQAIYNDLYD